MGRLVCGKFAKRVHEIVTRRTISLVESCLVVAAAITRNKDCGKVHGSGHRRFALRTKERKEKIIKVAISQVKMRKKNQEDFSAASMVN